MTAGNHIASAIILIMLVFSRNAGALEIGELRVGSHLGEAFAASVRIVPSSPSETVDSSCVALDQGTQNTGIFQLKHARLSVEASGSAQTVKISTSQSINEPIVTLQLHIHCSSQGETTKSFTVFLDPASAALPSPPEIPQAAEPVPAKAPQVSAKAPEEKKSSGNEIRIKPNDTLSGIAYDFFPKDKRARRRFIASVLRENPEISPELLQVGSALRIPDLKSPGSASKKRVEAPPEPEEKPTKPERTAVKAPSKPAFHLDIVSGEPKPDANAAQDLKRTETQLITRADDQTIQMLQLKDQVKSLEAKLAELQNRVVVANKLLSRINETKPREEEAQPISKWAWIAVLFALMGAGGGAYWYLRKKKAEERDALMDQYINPTLSKPALIDHLDYFESDTPDHHKW